MVSGGMEHSSSVQSLVESIDDDDVLRLTEMTKRMVEHSAQGQKRNRIISPPSNTQVYAEFQPSEKTLQLSNQYKAAMESRYASIFAALETHQPPPNPLITLRETMAKIDNIPRAIVQKYNTTRKISMEAANASSGGGSGANSGGAHSSRSKKSKDKYVFVSRVLESQCIWDVDLMKLKAGEIEARYQASASNPTLRYITPSQSNSMDSLATSGTMETAQTTPAMPAAAAASSPTLRADHKEDDMVQQPSTHPPVALTSAVNATPLTVRTSPQPTPSSTTTTPLTSTSTTSNAIPSVSSHHDNAVLLDHQTHAGRMLHQPHLQGEPSMTVTISPATTLTSSQSSSRTALQSKESVLSSSRTSLDNPPSVASTGTATFTHTNGSLSPLLEAGESQLPPAPAPPPPARHQHPPHNLHTPAHLMSLETSGPKRGSILGIFGIKGNKKTGPEESSSDKSADKRRSTLLFPSAQGEVTFGSPGVNSHAPMPSLMNNGQAATITSATAAPTPALSPVSATFATERKSLERPQNNSMPEVIISPTDAKSNSSRSAVTANTPSLAGSASVSTAATKGTVGRKVSLEEPQRQQPLPGLGHGLLFHGGEDGGGSTEDELPMPSYAQGERLDDSQDEADAHPHKRSSLRRFTDLIMWKRQHKGMTGLHEHFADTATGKRAAADPTVLHLQHNGYGGSRISHSQPSSGRNSLEGARPKVFSLSRVKSITSSPVLEPGVFEGGNGNGGMSTPSTTANSTAISPKITPTTPIEGLQPTQRPGPGVGGLGVDKSPRLYSRQSYLSGTTNQDRSPSMRAVTPNEELQQQPWIERKMMEGTGPVLVDVDRIPKAILDQLKEQPALSGVSWDHDTVDLRPLLASGTPLPTYHEFFGITSTMKAMEGYPTELQAVDLLDIHVQLDHPEPKDYLRMRAHVWDALEMREDFMKTAFQWAHDRQHDMEHHLMEPSPELGGLEESYYCGLQEAENVDDIQFDDEDEDEEDDYNDHDDDDIDDDDDSNSDDYDDEDKEEEEELKAMDSPLESTGYTSRGTDDTEWTDADDQAQSSVEEATVDGRDGKARATTTRRKTKSKERKSKSKQQQQHQQQQPQPQPHGAVGGSVGRRRGMSFSTAYHFRKPHIVPLDLMRANKQRELHAHAGSMSSMYARGGFKGNVEQTREGKSELSAVMAECRARLMRLQATTGKSLQEKEQVYKMIIDNFTVEWNDSYFVKLKDVEEQIQGMNQKRIENPWMDMLLILLSWLVRGLFYLVEGVTLVIIIVRHTWGKAKTTFQAVRTARRERERQVHGGQPSLTENSTSSSSSIKSNGSLHVHSPTIPAFSSTSPQQ
ncbi:hypothetical protein BGZ73_001131 [Actinomortierella ambigua]|nr:hypothetical protein BGZ73_001131 [Actinomortierella ambigua]